MGQQEHHVLELWAWYLTHPIMNAGVLQALGVLGVLLVALGTAWCIRDVIRSMPG